MSSCHFSRALARNETQAASSRIWTRTTDSIFFYDNHYAKRIYIISSIPVKYKPFSYRFSWLIVRSPPPPPPNRYYRFASELIWNRPSPPILVCFHTKNNTRDAIGVALFPSVKPVKSYIMPRNIRGVSTTWCIVYSLSVLAMHSTGGGPSLTS